MSRVEKFKMEREGLVKPGDEVHISEHKSGLYAYIIEPAVAMSGCYAFRDPDLKPHRNGGEGGDAGERLHGVRGIRKLDNP